jgi:hypothetical protein
VLSEAGLASVKYIKGNHLEPSKNVLPVVVGSSKNINDLIKFRPGFNEKKSHNPYFVVNFFQIGVIS